MTRILKVWRQIENQTPLIEAYLYMKNIPAKCHPDPIWSGENLGSFEDGRPKKKKIMMTMTMTMMMSSDMTSVCD